MDHHRPPHPIDHEKHNRASDAHYESKRTRSLWGWVVLAAFFTAMALIVGKGFANVLHTLAGVGV